MTVPKTASIFPCVFDAVEFGQVRGYELTPGMNLTEVVTAGTVDRAAVIESHSDPVARLETNDLLKVFANVDLVSGFCFDDSIFQAQRRLHCGVFDPAQVHSAFNVPGGGFLHIERFSWRQDDIEGAQCSLMCVPFYNGTDFPFTILENTVLQGTAAFNSHFFGGKLVIDVGGQLQTFGLTGLDVEIGMDFRRMRSDGDVYARTGSVIMRKPVITATFISDDAWKADPIPASKRRPGLFFNSQTGSGNLDFYLYQGIDGGRRYPLANNNHIRLRINALSQWNVSRIGGRDYDNVETTWEIRPIQTGWSIATNVAVA